MDTMNEGAQVSNPVDEAVDAMTATMAPKADLTKRAIAAVIDFAIASLLSRIPFVGWFAGIGYILVRDGLDVEMVNRQSVGKKVMGLKTVRLDGEAMDIPASVRRNWMFALGTLASFFVWVPILGFVAVIIAALLSFLIGVYEIYLVFTESEGRRWGDSFAGTKVIETDE